MTPAKVDAVVIGPGHLDSFAFNIASGFAQLGLGAQVLDPYSPPSGLSSSWIYRRSGSAARRVINGTKPLRHRLIDRRLGEVLVRLQPRIVVSTLGYLTADQVAYWRQLTPGSTWVFWYPDAIVNLGPHRMLLAPYDLFCFKDPFIVDLLSARTRLNVRYLPQAANPRIHRAGVAGDSSGIQSSDIVLAGNLYTYRLLLLEGLMQLDGLRIYGNPKTRLPPGFAYLDRARVGRPIRGLEKAQVFSSAAIVLNTMHFGEIGGVNSRLFEATACGAFVLTHESAALSRYFVPGKEVATFNSIDDLNGAIEYYMSRPAARREIAERGAKRAHADHTYAVRLRQLLCWCGLEEGAWGAEGCDD